MNLPAIALLTIILLGCAALAQPMCFTNYDAESYCEYARYPTIFIARVKKLTKETQYSMLGYKAADVEVYRTIKGAPLGKIATIALRSGCAGNIAEGGLYIFNLNETAAGTAILRADHWSRIDELSDADTAVILDGLDAVIAGKDQPMLVGRVTEPDGQPFANVKVLATDGEKALSVTTDSDGRYVFDKLPEASYKISVKYPLGYGPNDEYDKPRGTDERDFQARKIENWPCGTRLNFSTQLSARILGTLRVEGPPSGMYPYYALVSPAADMFGDRLMYAQSYSYLPEDGSPGPIGFKFFHVPAGRYLLKVGIDQYHDKISSFYYPGVRSARDAKVIEIGPGTRLDLDFALPALASISVSGRMQLVDGTRLFGDVNLVDADAPDAEDTFSPADRDRDDIKFTFKAPKGRRYYLCAGFDGAKNGRPIHLYKKLLLDGTTDHEDLVVILDQPIPKGVYWWDACRRQ